MKTKVKRLLKKILLCISNPRLLFCLFIAWMITNGWSYIGFALGMYFKIDWLFTVSSAYLTWLWLPISPEKLITLVVAIGLLKLFFPNDTKTLAVLKDIQKKAKEVVKKQKEKRKSNKERRKNGNNK